MRRWIVAVICMLLLTGTACAADLPQVQFDWADTSAMQQALNEESAELMEGISPDSASLSDGSLQIFKGAWENAGGIIKTVLLQAGQMIAVVLLCSMTGCLENSKVSRTSHLAGILAISLIGLAALRSLTQTGAEVLQDLKSYADLLLPALTMATATCGGFSASSLLYVGTVAFVDFLTNLVVCVLQPMVFLYLAMACAGAAVGNASLNRLKETLGWLIGGSLKTVLFVFTAYLTITGVVAGNADSTTVKAAKLTLSGVVPVVGGMLSDASETLVVSAGILRNSIGVFGMLAVLAVCAMPFLQAGVRYLVFKLTAAVCGTFDESGLTPLIGSVSDAAGYLLAMTGTCALMLMISVVCYIKIVVV